MASAVAELETGLTAMLGLKPPGVSGSRINGITQLCVSNVQSESVLIQKIFTHFKKTPPTHKLGVLYVVDSVTRKWADLAKQHGQPINSAASDGTYAAGVHRVTELMPVLMNDITSTAPEEQKEKIKKLVDIWEKGQTFPTAMIESFKQRLNAPPQNRSTTPIGSPPPGPGLPGLPESKPATEAPNAIMEALANIARQNTSVPPTNTGLPAPTNSYNAPLPSHNATPPQAAPAFNQSQPGLPFPSVSQPVNQALPYAFPPQPAAQGLVSAPPNLASTLASVLAGASQPPAPTPAPVSGVDPNMQQQVMLIKLLADQGIPFDKIPAILAGMQGGVSAATPVPAAAPQNPYPAQWGQPKPDDSRDRNAFQGMRSPDRYRGRSRSRSPGRNWDPRRSPPGRNDRDYSGYGRNSPGRHDYRQRSPPGRRGRSPSPPNNQPNGGEKWVEFDRSIPQGHIRVLSRTLFVGGVTMPESELRGLFGRHGTVQTCIVNKDKRHAFVKMLTRRDAIAAREAMDNFRGSDFQLRTRWGVGFGPRDCSDYQTGISVIPISKLTEADRKWMLTAEFGGSGGRPIESGLVVEEPDIEIGAGVSSKAISRRMQTDKGGRHGPKSSHDDDVRRGGGGSGGGGGGGGNVGRGSRRNERDDGNPNNIQISAHNHTQGGNDFPYGIATAPNGMPLFPPGFAFPPPA